MSHRKTVFGDGLAIGNKIFVQYGQFKVPSSTLTNGFVKLVEVFELKAFKSTIAINNKFEANSLF